MTDAFQLSSITGASFVELLASAQLEDLGKGRRGGVLVRLRADGAVPLVRTTTQYKLPAQRFRPIHDRIAAELPYAFNNALIEHYTPAYSTMKRHSDQALDLADGSWIAIASVYADPSRPSRRLVAHPKQSGEPLDLVLAHGSVVAFSLATNRRYTHTIATVPGAPSDWLGLTFRTSKTFTRPALATDDERRAFFALRRRENDEVDFQWPPIDYTISESDLLAPV